MAFGWLLAVVLLHNANSVMSACTCPPLMYQLPSGKMPQYCYYFTGASYSASNAHTQCQTLGDMAEVAVPGSAEENMAITEYVTDNHAGQSFVLGLTDQASEATWIKFDGTAWSATGNYFNWDISDGEPDGGTGQNCLFAFWGWMNEDGFTWFDISCSHSRQILCRSVCVDTTAMMQLLPHDPTKCFQSTAASSWSNGDTACQALTPTARLAPVTSTSDFFTFKMYALALNDDMWTGLNDDDDDGVWDNIDGTTPAMAKADIDSASDNECGAVKNDITKVELRGENCGNSYTPMCMHDCPCASNPCANGGTCRMPTTQDGWECVCNVGFTGADCSTADDATYGWVYQALTGKCYGLGPAESFFPAVQYCSTQQNGAIASLHNANDMSAVAAFVAGMTSAPTRMWVGLHDTKTEGTWVWTDGTAYDWIGSNLWNTGEPNNSGGSEDCGEWLTSTSKCNDLSCSYVSRPICVWDNTSPCTPVNPCQNGGTCNHVDCATTYTCTCDAGYTDPTCTTNMDECVSNPCQNDGTCNDGVDGYTCACVSAYTSTHCETEINECVSNPCQNGGACTDILDGYTCACTSGWTSTNCETSIDECWSTPCQNGGVCNDLHLSYSCTCAAGYTSTHCETNIDECWSDPCQNDGTCNDGVNQYTCSCVYGYGGTHCQTQIDYCASDPCQNGGTCVGVIGGYSCTCDAGWTATLCDTSIDDCQPTNNCLNGASCVDGHMSYTCTCAAGFTDATCSTNIDECASEPCQWCMPCNDLVDGYACDCTQAVAYTGTHCEIMIGFCDSNPCQNGATCTSYLGYYTCTCDAGYTGIHCETDINECASNPCVTGTCSHGIDTWSCSCTGGATGTRCEVYDWCSLADPCPPKGTCSMVLSSSTYHCECQWGWAGRNCTDDIATYPSPPGTCSDRRGFRICVTESTDLDWEWCRDYVRALGPTQTSYDEFALSEGDKCCWRDDSQTTSLVRNLKPNECTDPCPGNVNQTCGHDDDNRYEVFVGSLTSPNECDGTNPCQNGGCCVDETTANGGYTCLCAPGYTGTTCQTENTECSSNPCLNDGTCNDGLNSYTCTCPSTAVGSRCETSQTCNSSPCQNGGTCQELSSAYYCSCPMEWTGDVCQDVNDCACNNCTNGATCVDLVDDFACQCVLGFTGYYCEIEIDECISTPCQQDSTCHDYIAYYECECQAGFTSTHCETNIDDCWSDPCMNGAVCNDGIVLYTCDCVLGYTGYNCEIEIDECVSNPCVHNATCLDFVARYYCMCDPGFTGYWCTADIIECISDPCQNGGTCVEPVINMYACYCVPGFSGYDCQIDIDECSSNPCQNGGICNDLINHYTCDCAVGYTNTDCEIEIDECQSMECFNGGTCNDFIGWYNCTCLAGFTDFHCETDIDECASTPCVYFDVCYEGIDVWWCDCTVGYTDTTCSTELDECISEPCQFNSTCNDHVAFYDCSCTPGYTGYNCEQEIDECWSNPCQYWGTCNDYVNYYWCDCIPGITGLDCEVNIDECASTPCNRMDSNATCNDQINGYNCTCLPEWTETHCDLETAIWEILQLFKSGALADLSALRDIIAQSSLIVDSVPFIVATMPMEDRWPLSWSTNDTIMWCSYEGKSCVIEEDITVSSDPVMGNCFTFNPESLMHYKLKRAGQGQGLIMYLSVNQEQYTPWVDLAGMRIYIHNQSDSVYAESVSYSVAPGYFTTLGLRWKEMTYLGKQYSTCFYSAEEATSGYYYDGAYSAEGCLRSCYQNEVLKECGCMDPRFPSKDGETRCGLNERTCVNNFIDTKGDPSMWDSCAPTNKMCPPPCYSGSYDVTLSRSRYRKLPPSCSRLPANETAACADKIQNDLVKIEVYFEDFSYIVQTEVPRFPIAALLGEVGGQMGILAGMSVFSCAEIIFTFVQVAIVLLTGKGYA